MSIFQKSVVNRHLKRLDRKQVSRAYQSFQKFYGNQKRLQNIMQLKEENYQEGFLREIFVQVLGYTLNPDENYNLTTEYKNLTDNRKADGAILATASTTRGHAPLSDSTPLSNTTPLAIGVIELKSTKTRDLESIKEQAFGYKNNQPECKYVITSNFRKLRFYIDNATEYEEFDLFEMAQPDTTNEVPRRFAEFFLFLSKDNLLNDLPEKLKEETQFHEQRVTENLYNDYQAFKDRLFENLTSRNPQYDKLTLFKKAQKLLDRILFILFAEDSGLIPPNAISKIIEQWKQYQELDDYRPLYSRFQKFFRHLEKGHVYKNWGEIPAYNGGLFAFDEILDSPDLKIPDGVLQNHAQVLSAYDFSSEVDVNILGHIFEHSLSEIEKIARGHDPLSELSAQARGHDPLSELSAQARGHDPLSISKISKRKKDGIFYTPKYITQYIVENTVGALCAEKKKELQINDLLIDVETHGRASLHQTLNAYKSWLLSLKILDPACGSGAFLNATLDFLIAEHKEIDDKIAELTGDTTGGLTRRLFDTDTQILENNIYGVDINEESVEIAKLSLWLRTARRGRPLSDLSGNIKCGNSLIDNPQVAGEKAFDWQKEFPHVFREKKKEAWHITTATRNSRYSKRMFDNKVKTGAAIWLSEEDEILITQTVAQIVKNDNLNIVAYNICGDHMHLLLVCEENKRDRIVGKIKSITARTLNIAKGYTTRVHAPLSLAGEGKKRGETQTKLWTQKFGKVKISDNKRYVNTLNYIRNNRKKHELPENHELQKAIDGFVCPTNHAFRTEYTGGFDVVLGNPPYGVVFDKKAKKYLTNFDDLVPDYEIYIYFISLATKKLLKTNGSLGYIFPNTFLSILYGEKYRKNLLNNFKITEIVDLSTDHTFADAAVRTCIFALQNKKQANYSVDFKTINPETKKVTLQTKHTKQYLQENTNNWLSLASIDKSHLSIIQKVKNNPVLNEFFDVSQGVIPYDKYRGHSEYQIKNRVWHADYQKDESYKKELKGGDVSRYRLSWNGNLWISYGSWLAAPRKKDFFVRPRVLVREITNRFLFCCYTEKEYYNTPSLINIIEKDNSLNLKYLLAILNSKLIGWYHNNISPKAKKGLFPKILINDVRSIPVKPISQAAQQPFIEKAERMLSLNKALQTKSETFIKRVNANFDVEKISKKLQHFYDFDFRTFLKELKKQKISLSLTAQDEWESYFDEHKTEINEWQHQINQTDAEIDSLVYELYQLTAEEIEEVEKAAK